MIGFPKRQFKEIYPKELRKEIKAAIRYLVLEIIQSNNRLFKNENLLYYAD